MQFLFQKQRELQDQSWVPLSLNHGLPAPSLFGSGNFRHAPSGRGSQGQNQRTRSREAGGGSCRGSAQLWAALPGSGQGRPACELERGTGLTHLFPSASEGKILKLEEQSFDGGKKEGRKLYIGKFRADMEGWEEQNPKEGEYIDHLFLLGWSHSPPCHPSPPKTVFRVRSIFGNTLLGTTRRWLVFLVKVKRKGKKRSGKLR